jgi:hypothetical protein
VCRRSDRGRHSMFLTALGLLTLGIALILAIVFKAGPDVISTLAGILALAVGRLGVSRLGNQASPRLCPSCSREGQEGLPTSGTIE